MTLPVSNDKSICQADPQPHWPQHLRRDLFRRAHRGRSIALPLPGFGVLRSWRGGRPLVGKPIKSVWSPPCLAGNTRAISEPTGRDGGVPACSPRSPPRPDARPRPWPIRLPVGDALAGVPRSCYTRSSAWALHPSKMALKVISAIHECGNRHDSARCCRIGPLLGTGPSPRGGVIGTLPEPAPALQGVATRWNRLLAPDPPSPFSGGRRSEIKTADPAPLFAMLLGKRRPISLGGPSFRGWSCADRV